MTAEPDEGPDRPATDDDVGSLGDEAAKLLGALSDWARDRPAAGPSDDPTGESPSAGGSGPGQRHQLGEQLAAALHRVDEHVATGSAECRYCPVCRVVDAVRSTSPEVRAHLTSAAGSLLEAAAGLLATQVPGQRPSSGTGETARRGDGVEHIDLDPDFDPDEGSGSDGGRP